MDHLQHLQQRAVGDSIKSLEVDAAGSVWIGTEQGLSKLTVLPSLSVNHPSGAPGSFFNFSGDGFPESQTATISVNGQVLGTQSTDANGEIFFTLNTTDAQLGSYFVTVSVNPSATARFKLEDTKPIWGKEGDYTVFDVPGGIALTKEVFLPLIFR